MPRHPHLKVCQILCRHNRRALMRITRKPSCRVEKERWTVWRCHTKAKAPSTHSHELRPSQSSALGSALRESDSLRGSLINVPTDRRGGAV
eukprot:6213821-Pleurochrysis_carterae.AAC.3